MVDHVNSKYLNEGVTSVKERFQQLKGSCDCLSFTHLWIQWLQKISLGAQEQNRPLVENKEVLIRKIYEPLARLSSFSTVLIFLHLLVWFCLSLDWNKRSRTYALDLKCFSDSLLRFRRLRQTLCSTCYAVRPVLPV